MLLAVGVAPKIKKVIYKKDVEMSFLEIFTLLDKIGFVMNGLGTLGLFLMVLLTVPSRVSDVFETPKDAQEYVNKLRYPTGKLNRLGWWLIEKANMWLLHLMLVAILFQVPLKFFRHEGFFPFSF